MNVLVIAPHPDDDVLGCGGVMARHADSGDAVHVAVVTRGDPRLFPEEQVSQVRAELASAHRILGVAGREFLDFPAPRTDTVGQHEIVERLRDVLRSVAPQTIYLPHRADCHADHRIVFSAALAAARSTPRCTVRRILCYETLSETEWAPPAGDAAFLPTRFVDIASTVDRKLGAFACFASQWFPPPHPRSLESIERLARLRGATAGLTAAEAFAVVCDVVTSEESSVP